MEHTPDRSTSGQSRSTYALCHKPGPHGYTQWQLPSLWVPMKGAPTKALRPGQSSVPGGFRLMKLWRSSLSLSFFSLPLHVCRLKEPEFDIFPELFQMAPDALSFVRTAASQVRCSDWRRCRD
jgi:hypothetical protein